MHREIEVKYRARDANELWLALHARGMEFSSVIRQDDQAYAESGWQYGMSKVGRTFARLRTQDGRHIFTLKRPTVNEQACLEFETEVSDREQMHQALVNMGFYPTVRIVKTRRTGSVGERLTVCVDEVEHAGVFLELEEMIGPGESGLAVQASLDTFARSLGIDLERTTETYDSLVRLAIVPA